MTKKKNDYETAKHITETLQYNEVMLLAYIRDSFFGDVTKFRAVAKLRSEAYHALAKLNPNSEEYEQNSIINEVNQ